MRTEKEIREQYRQLMKIYKSMGSVEEYRHPETRSMVVTLEWVLNERDELPHYPEDVV